MLEFVAETVLSQIQSWTSIADTLISWVARLMVLADIDQDPPVGADILRAVR